MSKMKFMTALTSNLKAAKAMAGHTIYKNGPKAMIIGGCALTVAAVVLAIQESTEVSDEGKTTVDEVNEFKNNFENVKNNVATKKDELMEKARVTVLFLKQMFRRYIWSIVALSLGISLVCGSHHIMANRLANTGAIVTVLTNRLKEQESRIREKCDPDLANDILNNVTTTQSTNVNPETGEVTISENKSVRPFGIENGQARYIIEISEEMCPRINFIQTNRHQALQELKFVQTTLQYQLQKNGGITVWDVLKELGYRTDLLTPKEKEMCKVIGIVCDKGTNPTKFIDFGLDSTCKAESEMWADGEIDCFYIRPNWDGYVADKF